MIARGNCSSCGNCEYWHKRKEDGVFICVNKKNKDKDEFMSPTSQNHKCDNHRYEEIY